MKSMYVYIVRCSDNSYYTGVTNDPHWRVQEHNEGRDTKAYTYKRRPVELVFYEIFHDPGQAIEFEKQVKGWSRKKKEALIRGDWDGLPALSQCQNKTHYRNTPENN